MSNSAADVSLAAVLVACRPVAHERDRTLMAMALERLRSVFGSDCPVYVIHLDPLTSASVISEAVHTAAVRSERDWLVAQSVTFLTEKDVLAALRVLMERHTSDRDDSLALFYDWYPLLDAALTGSVFEWHRTYLAHFTYGENLPLGLAPDFCSREFLETVPAEVRVDDLRAYVFKHIDRYDVEIFFQPPDLRQYRLDFSLASARSQRLVRDVMATDERLDYMGLADYLQKFPEIMCPFPSCLEIEPCADTDGLVPVFYPTVDAEKSRDAARLELSLIEKLIGEIEAHALTDDLSIILGGPGECMLHPDFPEIVRQLASSDSVRQLFIETYGLALTPDIQTALNSVPAAEKIRLIIRCNTLQADRFQTLYGVDRLAQQLQQIQALEARTDLRFPVYVEMLRMEINADEVDNLFERFKETGIQVLLAAYNRFAGALPERRAADLTPLHRDFCWHLARDVYINAEGKMPLCKQDPYGRGSFVQNFHETTLMDYWQHTRTWHAASVRGRHEAIPIPCLQCDEWYTFNA